MRLVAVNWRDLAHPQAGGSELLVDRLLTGFAQRGHDVTLVCGGPVSDHAYPVVDIGGTYTQYLWAPVVYAARFSDADVLIDVENGIPYFSPLWRRRPSVCLVHHVHTDQWHGHFPATLAALGQAAEQHLMPAVYRHRLFVAVSRSTAQDLEAIGVDPAQIRVIENGVDLPDGPLAPKSPTPLFLALSRLVPHKRVDLLLSAWEEAQPVVGGRLVVAGDGPELPELRRRAAGIPGAEVVGRIDETEKARLLAESWLLVHAAHHEGWGMAVLEAAASGTPALAVDAPGVRDAVVDGSTGILVDAPDDELAHALALAWMAAGTDADLRDRLGRAARQRAAGFGWDRTVDAWLDVIEEARRGAAGAGTDGPARRGRSRWRPPPPGPVRRGAAAPTAAATAPTAAATAPSEAAPTRSRPTGGMARSLALFKGFRSQFDDPDAFYTLLADDTAALLEQYQHLEGQRVVDVGGGPGYFAEGFRRHGARAVFVEPFWDEMTAVGRSLGYGVVADGLQLPFGDGAFDLSHSSNVIEHVDDPERFLDELVRVVRPGGTIFLAFTNWLSPYGGHETSPWHYLGGDWAAHRYERHQGYPPKNRFGSSLYRLGIGEVLRWARSHPGAELLDAFPRYYPGWTRPVVSMPGLREVVTWNLALVLRRR